jgi:hypothetical protein
MIGRDNDCPTRVSENRLPMMNLDIVKQQGQDHRRRENSADDDSQSDRHRPVPSL